MLRVVRSTLVGLLTLAAVAACGDSDTTTPIQSGTVHSVTVSPPSLTISVGGTGILAASVDADGDVDRTVTWSSSDPSVASVDAATGKVTGAKAGTVTVTATSKANTSIQAAAEAAAAPVTLSFNTAQLSSAGVAALHNGTCTISAQATTAAGTQSAVNSTTLTLN